MSTDIKLSNAQLFKRIQSGGFLGNIIGTLGKGELMKFAVLFSKDVLLQTRGTSSLIDNFEVKNVWNMDNIIRIIKLRQNSGLLIDGVTETVKYEIKKKEGGLLGALLVPLVDSLIAPMASSLIGNVLGKGVSETEKDNKVDFFGYYYLYYFHSHLEKESLEQEKDIIWIIWIKFFSTTPLFRQYQDY